MRKLKQALSLSLAFVLSLALAVPAMAAGETTIQDGSGFSYTLSKPLVGTRGLVYQISEGTIITPVLPEGTVKEVKEGDEYDHLAYTLPDGSAVEYSVWFCVDASGGITQEVEESWNIVPVGSLEDKSVQPLSTGLLYYLLRDNDTNRDYGEVYIEVVPDSGSVTPDQPTTPVVTVEDIPASGTAVASTQTVTVDGKAVEFQMYALVDENGNGTNYIKLRDMAQVLNGTAAQFSVGYDNASKLISVTTGGAYASTGTEMTTPFSGNRSYTGGAQTVQINGSAVDMTAITLLDDAGGGYNYFKLRDLGAALGFNVGYSSAQGVYIESDKPYLG